MRRNRASTTAQMVAVWRALADKGYTSVPGFRDPYAAEMLSGVFRRFLFSFIRRLERMSADERLRTLRRFDPVAIRVAVIDAAMIDAVKAGCRQVVILGAGFDTRAYRFEELSGVTLFEVDHPATQNLKRERAAALPPAKARMVWVPVDFEREALAGRLEASGHDASAPTVWLWEGVVMYLGDEAVESTLEAVRSRSAPGSVLVLHYHEPSRTSLARALRKVFMSWVGEPQVGTRTRGEMGRMVDRAGFVVQEDLGMLEQASRVGAVAPDNDLGQVSRILVAGPRS